MKIFKKKMNAKDHYDSLIEQDNDPVRDPQILKDYMDKWDGEQFIRSLALSGKETVLEIGVGTGRLAVKTVPACREFYGIDLSDTTVERAKENLSGYCNTQLIAGDYLAHEFGIGFDVIYSSLTLMHIEDKKGFFEKVFRDLKPGGRLVISTDDENKNDYIDTGDYRVKVYPDKPEFTQKCLIETGFAVQEVIVTEFAHIFVCIKG